MISDFLLDWLKDVQQSGQKELQEAIRTERQVISELEQKLAFVKKPQDLQKLIEEKEKELAALKEEKKALELAIKAEEDSIEDEKRDEIQSLLENCETIISSQQTQVARELLEAAQSMLDQFPAKNSTNLYKSTPRQLERFFYEQQPEVVVRESFSKVISQAWDGVKDQAQVQEELRAIQEEQADLQADCLHLSESLMEEHQMSEMVLEHLRNLSEKELRRFREQFLKEKLEDAKLEQSWALPANVLGELQ